MCCCCCTPLISVIAAFVSCGLALYLMFTAEPVFTSMYKAYQDPTYKMTTGLLDKLDNVLNFFGARKIDAGKPVRILLWTSGLTLLIAAAQVMSNVALLIGATKKNRASILTFTLVSCFMCSLLLACLYGTQQYFPMTEDDWSRMTPKGIKDWQVAILADGIFLLYATFHALCFVRSDRRSLPVVIRGGDGVTYMAARQA